MLCKTFCFLINLMKHTNLALVTSNSHSIPISISEKQSDHNAILSAYSDTHVYRGYTERTVKRHRSFLDNWFKRFKVPDDTHPDGERQLYVWEVMQPHLGRRYIREYHDDLIASGIRSGTRMEYIQYLRNLFEYVLDEPYIPNIKNQSIVAKYNALTQPVTKYDCPTHVVDIEREGFALTTEQLINFYDFIRLDYIEGNQKKGPASRDYTMIVIAATSGLRANEVEFLDTRDLYFENGLIETRFGKGFNGSGKRPRKTDFTDFAMDTMRYYLRKIRPRFPNADANPALFLTEGGDRISYSTMRYKLKRIVTAAKEVGIDLPPDLRWHDLRRSFATNYVEERGALKNVLLELAEKLGHSNLYTLHHYIKHNREYRTLAVEHMHRILMRTNPEEG